MSTPGAKGERAGFAPWVVFIGALALGVAAALWYFQQDMTLEIGDAAAHLNIARRLVDSRDISPLLIGTGWLPLPHLLMAPFVLPGAIGDWLWRTGLAGAMVNVPALAAASLAMFLLLRTWLTAEVAWIAAAIVATNPNLLYLAATPMTEPLSLSLMLWALYLAAAHKPAWCGLISGLACLTRYEAWVMLPLLALYLWHQGGFRDAVRFTLLAAWAPLWWLAHNWWYWGDALEFYRGEYSAQAVYARELAAGVPRFPAQGNWLLALRYFLSAAVLVCGVPLAIVGALGWLWATVSDWRGKVTPLVLLAAPCLVIVVSLHSAGVQIYVPSLWPGTLMNTRYALSALPFIAVGAAFIACRRRPYLVAVAICAVTPWLGPVMPEEAVDLGQVRVDWTAQAAGFLKQNYKGGGIALSFGDATAVLQDAGVPLKEALYDGSRLQFEAAIRRPDLFLNEQWVLAMEGDRLAQAASKTQRYWLVRHFDKAQFWMRLPEAPTAADPVARQ